MEYNHAQAGAKPARLDLLRAICTPVPVASCSGKEDETRASHLNQSQSTSLPLYRPTFFPGIKSRVHKFYLHHFITYTAAIYFPLDLDNFLQLIMPTSESRCIFGAIMAASSSHYYRLRGAYNTHIVAIEATVETLSALRKALIHEETGSEILATSLMLATTCLCAGDTATYRQHLDGALKTVRRRPAQEQPDVRWSFCLKWLTQLFLMNQLSGLPSPAPQTYTSYWEQLLVIMPESGKIDKTTGLSVNLIALLDGICGLESRKREVLVNPSYNAQEHTCGVPTSPPRMSKDFHVQVLETHLCELRDGAVAASLNNGCFPTEPESIHILFVNAALLWLYKRAYGLYKEHPDVQATVDAIIHWLQKIDENSPANTPLLWPLLAAGCEASTQRQRLFIMNRMALMIARGLGNCKFVLEFMMKYWQEGGDLRWDVFAKNLGIDIILF